MENFEQNDENQKTKELELKCESCGANLSEYTKKCEYCGSINSNYKPKELKELKPDKQMFEKSKRMFGGFFGNVFEEFFDDFDEK